MPDYESIYDNHYAGDTYRFGVAYLRQETDDQLDSYAEPYPDLEQQRRVIEGLADTAQTLIIAEFIDQCGAIPAEDRPALGALLDFWHDTHPAVVFAASEAVLALDTSDNFHLQYDLDSDRHPVIRTGR